MVFLEGHHVFVINTDAFPHYPFDKEHYFQKKCPLKLFLKFWKKRDVMRLKQLYHDGHTPITG
ncbi:hypothetical protein HK14_13305 [Acetobacter cibinongensis]|uniref:Uncharacterized protein n=1 Tax=Acetobacter cibinongensis TaxID=146475 RepID=A0A1Z5YXK8_9PROT|nr:hypothetical protein HK14_13305 [Acetobacter cibinongensis]